MLLIWDSDLEAGLSATATAIMSSHPEDPEEDSIQTCLLLSDV